MLWPSPYKGAQQLWNLGSFLFGINAAIREAENSESSESLPKGSCLWSYYSPDPAEVIRAQRSAWAGATALMQRAFHYSEFSQRFVFIVNVKSPNAKGNQPVKSVNAPPRSSKRAEALQELCYSQLRFALQNSKVLLIILKAPYGLGVGTKQLQEKWPSAARLSPATKTAGWGKNPVLVHLPGQISIIAPSCIRGIMQ